MGNLVLTNTGLAGVFVSLLQDNRLLTPDPSGLLTSSPEAGSVVMEAIVESTRPIFGFTVTDRKDIYPCLDMADQLDRRLYRTEVAILVSTQTDFGTEVCYVMYPNNSLKLVEQCRDDTDFDCTGRIRLWELALVAQHGDFYLTSQLLYETDCYRRPGGYVYPRFDQPWSDYLVSLLPAKMHVTRDARCYAKTDFFFDADSLREGQGIVEWFNFAQGFGCVHIRHDGKIKVARVHWKSFDFDRPETPRGFLTAGERVYFTSCTKPIRTRGRETVFCWEIHGVSPS